MTTPAVTDIKELVGEMPARGCELGTLFSERTACSPCNQQAQWIARIHTNPCGRAAVSSCDTCLSKALGIAEKWIGYRCDTCALVVNSVADLLGPVMPL